MDSFQKVSRTVRERKLIRTGDRLVAGISGGADSVCLLFMLCMLREELDFSWMAVHVNHGLRGEEALRDQAFVEALCREHNIPCRVYSRDVADLARREKRSLEEAGREVRRQCLEEAARDFGAAKVVLAHHQNDNAETLLLQIARGTGLAGLGGMRMKNGCYIRPLLCLTRQEIEGWLTDRGISWMEDGTNREDLYLRNRLRHHVLPYLEREVNPRTVAHMEELAEQMQRLWDYLRPEVERACRLCIREEGGDIWLQEAPWRKEPPYLQGEVLRQALFLAAGRRQDLGQVHVRDLEALLDRQVGKRLSLPAQVEAERVYEGVLFTRRGGALGREAKEPCRVSLYLPGRTRIPWTGGQVTCRVVQRGQEVREDPYTEIFSCEVMGRPLAIRTRESGDFIRVDSQGHRQSLKAWLINAKIPRREREELLLLADGKEILWILGRRRGAQAGPERDQDQVLEIRYQGQGGLR